MRNLKNKIIRRTRAKITKIKVVLNEGDEGGVLGIHNVLVYSGLRLSPDMG